MGLRSPAGPELAWLVGAAVLGFAASAVLSGVLGLSRNVFVAAYGAAVAVFLHAYFRASGISIVRHFGERPVAGLVAAALVGTLAVWNVLAQPVSPAPDGWGLVFAISWLGVFYGTIDALLLSVMPVMAVRSALSARVGADRPMRLAAYALSASALVTAAYHLGYAEFRGIALLWAVAANLVLSGAYVLSQSPLSSTLAHVAMHVAAVVHGIETAGQLPPH